VRRGHKEEKMRILFVTLVLAVSLTWLQASFPAAAQGSHAPSRHVVRTVVDAASPGQYPKVSGLRPFSLEANFMSLAGYFRFLVFARDGIWLSRHECVAIVNQQIATGE
jgi:hypothetical protein